ncbi:sensor histidine kinase [Terrisporobacter mayombei]|mgnify:FL=1|nr:HAMP domain-containing sensor histidine kinase [Terrisporobacter mayombei]MCC3670094.1 HAMP domain-containing histidine kinase [Terrisporobacter mayombei]
MINNIISDKNLIEKEKKIFEIIIFFILLISCIYIFNIFSKIGAEKSYLESTLFFIRSFSSILSLLAFGSCLISYNRLKKDSIFIIALMYLGLSVGIAFGQIDFLSFYYEEYTLFSYITVSASIFRMILLIIAIIPKSKIQTLIVKNKKISILFVILYTIVFDVVEKNINFFQSFHSTDFFIIYNYFLMAIYLISAIRLFILGIKEKEYIFVVLASSIFMLAIKAIYAVHAVNTTSFYVKLTSVSITYTIFLIVIAGSFIELYLYINRTKMLNDNLSLFYNLADNNKHSFMYICNEDGDILYGNKKFMEHYKVSSMEDAKRLKLYFSLSRSRIDNKNEIMESLNTKGVWRGIIKNLDGNMSIDCSLQVIETLGDKKEYAVTYLDISQVINKELELEKMKVYNKEKTEFMSNISHELRTPINIFYSTIQLLDISLLKSEKDFREVYAKYKRTLHVNCKRMLRLINNVVDISKIETGILKGKFDYYNLISIVEDVTLSVVNYAHLKSINIQFDTNEEEFITKCDPSMMERVLLNLLSNAIKFTPENKNIYVNIYVNDDFAEINIKDEGIGISKSDKAAIFERFVQADKSLTRENEGSGIGLSIVKSIIDLHGGYISVESEVGEGSTFKIILPNRYDGYINYKIYDINNYNTELELSDIYEILV